ncbi:MAG TPA: VWA domain-containing protein [Egibacteraceae bacterium]|nr:VWA domain-containing protein [Egibacteraceae bacterium]
MDDPSDHGLAEHVVAFSRELRAAGIAVSAPEIVDALEALPTLPLEHREVVRAGLAGTLCKEPALRPRFDRAFDLYFPSRRGPSTAERVARGGDPTETLTDALRTNDRERLRHLAHDRVQEHGDIESGTNLSEDASVFRALRGLNLDAILNQLYEDEVSGKGYSVLERRAITEDLTERMQAFRDMLTQEVFSEMLAVLNPEELSGRNRRPPPDEVDFLWANQSDLERMRAALVPLARKLTMRLSHRRRRARQGRLDLRRTIRGSLSTGGALVEPRFRRPVAGKPEIVLLCDISGSMRAFAKFTLELTYGLATQFQRVRTFVFVDALDEVTGLLQSAGSFPAALARVESEANVVEGDGQSWYGNCLEQFWQCAGRDIAPRTTVLVMGDARGNFRSTGVEYLERVADRARRLYWLNPEPRDHWDTGDSVMSAFAPACDEVVEVRNLAQLEAFVARAL